MQHIWKFFEDLRKDVMIKPQLYDKKRKLFLQRLRIKKTFYVEHTYATVPLERSSVRYDFSLRASRSMNWNNGEYKCTYYALYSSMKIQKKPKYS